MKSVLLASATFIFLLGIGFCSVPSMFNSKWDDSYALGKGLYMISIDHGKIVVQGSYVRDGICYGGDYVVPLYEECYDSLGNVREYVVNAVADEYAVMIKTFILDDKKYKYYLIDKTFDEKCVSNLQIRESFTYRFNSLQELKAFCSQNNWESILSSLADL